MVTDKKQCWTIQEPTIKKKQQKTIEVFCTANRLDMFGEKEEIIFYYFFSGTENGIKIPRSFRYANQAQRFPHRTWRNRSRHHAHGACHSSRCRPQRRSRQRHANKCPTKKKQCSKFGKAFSKIRISL